MIYARKLTFKTQRSADLVDTERRYQTSRAELVKMRGDCAAILESLKGARGPRFTWARSQFQALLDAIGELPEFDAGPLFAALEAAVQEHRATAALEREALTTEDLLTAKAALQIANRAVAAAESAIAAAFAAHKLPRDVPELSLTLQDLGRCRDLAAANRAILDEVIRGDAPDPFHESKAKDLDRWFARLPARDLAYLIANECALGVVPSSVDYWKVRWERFSRREGLESAA